MCLVMILIEEMDYTMSNWLYGDKFIESIEDVPEGSVSFIYEIQIDGRFYIGKKNLYTTRKKHFGKKKLATVTDKRLKTYEKVTTESNWLKYCSSSKEVKHLVEQGRVPDRRILRFCKSVKEARYFEDKLLFEHVGSPSCLNGNVGGRYFKEEIVEWKNM